MPDAQLREEAGAADVEAGDVLRAKLRGECGIPNLQSALATTPPSRKSIASHSRKVGMTRYVREPLAVR